MSIDAAKAFLSRMKSDEAFAKSVVEADSSEDRRALIAGNGFNFSPEEWDQVAGDLSAEELSDTDLDGAVGGAGAGNKYFEQARRKLPARRRGAGVSAAADDTMGSGYKCDDTGSENECVC